MQVDGYEVERHYTRFIEEELRRYSLRKIRIRLLEDEIIRSSPGTELGMPRGTDVSNPTSNRAMALMKDTELAHIRSMIATVDEVLKLLTLDQQKIIKHFYFETDLKVEDIADRLNMQIQSIYRERNRALFRFCYTFIGEHVVREVTKSI